MAKKWKFYDPEFIFLGDLRDFSWSGHMYFAYDLIRNLQPKVVAELGTYKGTSMFAMAQAIKDGRLKTEFNAVDCWEGDEQNGFYSDEVYDFIKDRTTEYFGEQNVRLHKMFFSEAVKNFKNHSIDVLHIDGLHTYEAVKEDYDTWISKLKKDGVIFFHDTKVAHYGVWKVWEEVKEIHKDALAIEFSHNYGLGVLFFGDSHKEMLKDLDKETFETIYKYKAEGFSNMVNLDQLNNRNITLLHTIKELDGEKKRLLSWAEELNSGLQARDEKIRDLEGRLQGYIKFQKSLPYKMLRRAKKLVRK